MHRSLVRKTSYTIATMHVIFHTDSSLISAVQTVLISDKINQRILQISPEGYNDICHPYYMVFRESAVLFQITERDRMCLRKNVLWLLSLQRNAVSNVHHTGIETMPSPRENSNILHNFPARLCFGAQKRLTREANHQTMKQSSSDTCLHVNILFYQLPNRGGRKCCSRTPLMFFRPPTVSRLLPSISVPAHFRRQSGSWHKHLHSRKRAAAWKLSPGSWVLILFSVFLAVCSLLFRLRLDYFCNSEKHLSSPHRQTKNGAYSFRVFAASLRDGSRRLNCRHAYSESAFVATLFPLVLFI